MQYFLQFYERFSNHIYVVVIVSLRGLAGNIKYENGKNKKSLLKKSKSISFAYLSYQICGLLVNLSLKPLEKKFCSLFKFFLNQKFHKKIRQSL